MCSKIRASASKYLMSNPFASSSGSPFAMWWRLIVLSGLFFGVTRIWDNESRPHRGTCIVVHNRANGHYYQWIPVRHIDFDNALSWSTDCHFAGRRGHLATIASQQENDFLSNHRQLIGSAWIAATDREQEGVWKWIAGEEAGQTFYIAGDDAGEHGFTQWAENEPNDRDNEDFAVFGWMSEANWNDLGTETGSVQGFLVEYDNLPEPDALVITTGNTHSPFFGAERPTIVGEKHGQEWNF